MILLILCILSREVGYTQFSASNIASVLATQHEYLLWCCMHFAPRAGHGSLMIKCNLLQGKISSLAHVGKHHAEALPYMAVHEVRQCIKSSHSIALQACS